MNKEIEDILDDFETQVMIAMGGGEIDMSLDDHDRMIKPTIEAISQLITREREKAIDQFIDDFNDALGGRVTIKRSEEQSQ